MKQSPARLAVPSCARLPRRLIGAGRGVEDFVARDELNCSDQFILRVILETSFLLPPAALPLALNLVPGLTASGGILVLLVPGNSATGILRRAWWGRVGVFNKAYRKTPRRRAHPRN